MRFFLGSLILGGENWGEPEKASFLEECNGSSFRGCAMVSGERLIFGSDELSDSEGVPLRLTIGMTWAKFVRKINPL